MMLYFRMLLMMGVSLFTVRVVLDTLGTVDYGLYNVVGGIVTMFSFLSATMSGASQRFFSFELGRKDYTQLKRIFSITLLIYAIFGAIVLFLAETVGLWFLNHKLTIPSERISAANWVYQFSIFSFIVTMFRTPYNAIIIANEKMDVYAYVSIVEVILKLLIVYLLLLFSFDKLKLYAALMFVVTLIVALVYIIYSRRKFEETKFTFYWNISLFKEILSFSFWNLFGAIAGIFKGQGVNIVLNMFFGPAVNAARGIAFQVNSALNQFVQNFMTATKPQIIKYYAEGEKGKMFKLVFLSSKLSFLLLFIVTMPVILETNFVFNLWLKETPEYVILFSRLILINTLIDSLSYPLITAAQATGKIKQYQALIGGVMLLNLPVSYFFLMLGYSAQSVFIIAIIISIINLFLRLFMLKKMIGLSLKQFVSDVLIRISITAVIAYILPCFVFIKLSYGISRFFIVVLMGFVSSCIVIYSISLLKNERKYIIKSILFIKDKIFHLN
ncbi:lipopolysaccharide biosynthesis protein [Maribellus luteus]|nr:oligosaccharide flippase family protein [Maribellus luteus]